MLVGAVTRRVITSQMSAFVAIAVVLVSATRASAQVTCSSEPLAVQVLGSGGPNAGGTRASTGRMIAQTGLLDYGAVVGGRPDERIIARLRAGRQSDA
jgi:hypothetical protein